MENEERAAEEAVNTEETANTGANTEEDGKKLPTATLEAAETVSRGKFQLKVPIMDGDKEYRELHYDFNKLTGWEYAGAMDEGAAMSGGKNAGNMGAASKCQCLCLFAAAAAKATEGLDKTDIKERLSAADGIAAMNLADIFFRGSLLAGSLRITKE